jgi:hypothetical protein
MNNTETLIQIEKLPGEKKIDQKANKSNLLIENILMKNKNFIKIKQKSDPFQWLKLRCQANIHILNDC